MSAPVDVGTEVAALHFYLNRAKQRGDDWAAVFAAVPVHRDAVAGSLVDDARIALGDPCPSCRAAAGQPCDTECSSRWDGGTP